MKSKLPVKCAPALLKAWILFCTVCVAIGWSLSLIGQLNVYGYVGALGFATVVGIFVVPKETIKCHLSLRRFRKPLPLMFAVVATLVYLGGVLHKPNNYDALTYRVPRLLQWVAEGRWHWIVTENERMNYSAPNFEWLTAPLFVLTKTDRGLFLLNVVPFLFLPGLIFSTYRMLGVKGKVAWAWMWILPTSYCFALQAGSIGNDITGAIFVLTSLFFSLRAWRTRQISDVLYAVLAIALATGVKASNLPLLLPCVFALWLVRRLLAVKPYVTTLVLATSVLVSYAPIAILNHHFTADWAGDPKNTSQLRISNPIAGILGNSLQLGTQTVQPPLLPGARVIQTRLIAMLPQSIKKVLSRDFPRFEPSLGEMPQEEAVGLGIAVLVLLLIIPIASAFLSSSAVDSGSLDSRFGRNMITASALVAFVAFMATMGSEATARLLCPYYLLLLPVLLSFPVNARLVNQAWWRTLAIASIGSTVVVLVLTPSRPLWPAETVLTRLQSRWPNSVQLARAQQVYAVYRERNDLLGPLRDYLPVDGKRICLIAGGDDSDLALWRPFGKRKVFHLVGSDWAEESQECPWVIGKNRLVLDRYGMSVQQLVGRYGGYVVAERAVISKVSTGPEEWFVVRTSVQDEVDHNQTISRE